MVQVQQEKKIPLCEFKRKVVRYLLNLKSQLGRQFEFHWSQLLDLYEVTQNLQNTIFPQLFICLLHSAIDLGILCNLLS